MNKQKQLLLLCIAYQQVHACVAYVYFKQRFADEHGLPLIEVSMKDGTNIEMAITHMVAKLWRRIVRLKQNSQDD